MKNKIFVYGSLMSGFGNHRILGAYGEHAEEATLTGNYKMISLGSFPALVKCENSLNVVHGELVSVPDKVFQRVDNLEGHPRFYRRQQVELDEGKGLAWCYFLDNPRSGSEVESCDWRMYKRGGFHFNMSWGY